MDSNEYFEKTYLDYYFLKDVLDKDKQYHIEGFVKNDLSDDSYKNIDNVNIFSLVIKYLIEILPNHTRAVIANDNIDLYKHKGYKPITLNKQFKFLSVKSNKTFVNSLNTDIIIYGFFDKDTKIFENIPSLKYNNSFYELNYSSKTLIEDLKKIVHNVQIYKLNHIIHKCKIEHTKLFFTNEQYTDKNNKTYGVLNRFNDVLQYKLIEEYNNSSYSAFFNSHLEYLYETIILYNKQSSIDDELNKIKSINNIIAQKIMNENETIKNTLNNIVIKNLTKERFPNLFNTNHKDCIFRSDKEFAIDLLPKKYKDIILLEHKKNQQYIAQVISNKCEHTKLALNSKNITEYFTAIEEFIDNDHLNDAMIPCKLCKFDLICPHEYTYYKLINDKKSDKKDEDSQMFKQDKHENQVNQIITNMYASDTSLQYKFYCKICGGFLSDDNNTLDSFKSMGSMSNASVRSIDDDLKKYIIKECFYIVSSYVDIERLDIEQKNIVWIITDIVIGQLSEINNKLSRRKLPPTEHDLLFKFHIKLLIFTTIILLISQTKVISFKTYSKSTIIKDLLNQCFTIFIKYASSIISKMSIQYIDIKVLLIDYYKLVVNNTISFTKEDSKDDSIKFLESSVKYKVVKEFINLYMGVKSNDLEKILNKNLIQPNKKQKTSQTDENIYDSIKIETNNKSLLTNAKFKSLLVFVKNLKYGTNDAESEDDVANSFKIKYENILKLPFSSVKFGLNTKKDINYVIDNVEKIDKKKFYNTYTYRCPVKDFHEFEKEVCVKCGIDVHKSNNLDEDYFKKYIDVYKKELNHDMKVLQKKVEAIISNYKKPVLKKEKIDTTLNINNINIVSNLFNIDPLFLIKLGAIEGIEYDLEKIKDFKIDTNERVLKLMNYMLHLTVEYNKFRSDKELSSKYPQITTNLIDMVESYKNVMNNDELINLLLNTIYSNIINIYNIDAKDNNLFIFLDSLVHKIIQFDEIFTLYDYANIKYLLRKSKSDDTIIDDAKYETNEVDEYDDIFGSDLFDESFDDNTDESDGVIIKTSDY